MEMLRSLVALSIVTAVTGLPARGLGAEKERPAELMEGLGNHHHPIQIHSTEGQEFFDQGMTLVYGFNHDEAVRSFRRAAALDPNAAMPLWGIAYALGPNINLDVDPEHEKAAYEATQKALELAKIAPDNERAYVEALAKRYSSDPKADLKKLAADFKDAMKDLSKRYPEDLDAATLYAESLMDLNPWKLWTNKGKPAAGTEELIAALESVLRRDPNHLGANHYYIHALEASPFPERALPSAARLEKLVSKSGHLVHMPFHIYLRTGDYHGAVTSNARAAEVDRKYIEETKAEGVYPLMYYNHNLQSLTVTYVMAGKSAEAKKTAAKLVTNVAPAVAEMPMAEFLLPMSNIVALRFQRWAEILKSREPKEKTLATRAFWHYARGIALAAKGDLDGAGKEQQAFAADAGHVPADLPWGYNTAKDVLALASSVLDARIAAAKGERKAAIAAWKKAAEAEDQLSYDEPPDWYYPVRESLGAALFLDGQFEKSEETFREDLERNRRNPRSLFGLWESLKAQKKSVDAEWVRRQFQEAWRNADVELTMADL